MGRSSGILSVIAFLLMLLISAGCSEDSPVVQQTPDLTDGRITIINDPGRLSARVEYPDTLIEVDSLSIPLAPLSKRGEVAAIRLSLRGVISPPIHNGTTLQATHVVLNNDYAYVAYNVQGSAYLGGVDVIDVHNKNKPTLVS